MAYSRVLFVAVLLLCSVVAAEWQVGVARIDITPAESLWMGGYAARKHPALGTLHPLWAKAIAIQDTRGEQVVLVTLDLLGDNFGRDLADQIRVRAQREAGLPVDHILFNFSHTHCGPVSRVNDGALVTYGLDREHQEKINRYTEVLSDKLVALISNAASRLQPARLDYGQGRATFAANRRTRYNPDGPVDHQVPVLRAVGEDGELIAVVFGYACHNTTLSIDRFNGDYAGFAQLAFERAHPEAMALFMMGCGGDANPDPRREISLAEQHGAALASAATQVLTQELKPVRGPLRVHFDRISLPFVPAPTAALLKARQGQGNVYDQRLTEILLARLANGFTIQESYPFPLQIVRFGDSLSLIGLAGETVVDYALRLRREFSGSTTWVAGYCNEVFAYVPSERVLREGGYEGAGGMKYFAIHGPFQPGLEDRIVTRVHELMKRDLDQPAGARDQTSSGSPFPAGELDRLAGNFHGRVGFYAEDLTSGARYAWHADERFPAASVIKLPVMIELYRQSQAGSIDLQAQPALPADISTHGTGKLAQHSSGVRRSLQEYCRLMIMYSDNMATDLLMRVVGKEAVNELLSDQQLRATRLSMELGQWHYLIVGMQDEPISRTNDARQLERVRAGHFDDSGLGYSDALQNNVASPRDMAKLLERLYLGRLAGPVETAKMLELLTASTHKQTIAKYLRPGTRVANKYGSSRRIAGDAGLVWLPRGPVAIAGFTLADDGNNRRGRELLSQMSRLIVRALAPEMVAETP